MLSLTEIVHGPHFRIYALSSETQEPCHEFLVQAEADMPKEHEKLMSLLDYTSKHGAPRNKEKCRALIGNSSEDQLFEFKTKMLRLFLFYDEGRVIICANGIPKGKAKEQNRAIQAARDWKKHYFSAKTASKITIISLP